MAVWFCRFQAAAGILGFAAALAVLAWGLPQARSAVFSAQSTLKVSSSLLDAAQELLARVSVVLAEAERSAGALSEALPGLRELSAQGMENAGYWKDYAARMAETTQGLSGVVGRVAAILPLKVPDGLDVEMSTLDVKVTKIHYPSGISPTYRPVLEKEGESLARTAERLSEIADRLSESARLMEEVSGENGRQVLELVDQAVESLALAKTELSALNARSLPALNQELARARRAVADSASATAGAETLLLPALVGLAFLPLLFFGNALVMLGLLRREARA